MRVLITGANGFLGYYLVQLLLQQGYEVVATGRGSCRLPFTARAAFTWAEMDITDPFAVHDVFAQHRPDAVVHAAAMSKPDECELNQWQAYLINTEGSLHVLMNAAEQRCHFIYVSTDFVFDGERGMYREEDVRSPVNYYGRTKMEAEDAVMEYAHDWCIVRTVLVYGKPVLARENILSITQKKLMQGEIWQVVDDQVRTPTYVGDLAAGIAAIIAKRAKGIYHLSGKDVYTPYQMAVAAAQHLQLNTSLIRRVTQDTFSQPAKRPPRTGFVIDKAVRELGYRPVSFEEGLQKTFSAGE